MTSRFEFSHRYYLDIVNAIETGEPDQTSQYFAQKLRVIYMFIF